eukprot:5020678-Amphidinium_carterae.1
MVKSVLLIRAVNGDWRRTDCIEHVVPAGEPLPPVEEVTLLIQHALLNVLAGTKPPVWVRHRWTGSDKSLDAIAAMFAIHGLLEPTYKAFLQLIHRGHATPRMEQHAPVPDDVDIEEHALATLQEEYPTTAPQTDNTDYSKRNAIDREKAWAWISSSPFASLLLMKLVLTPLMSLLYKQLELGSEAWELKQRAEQAKWCLEGNHTWRRGFTLLVAAQQKLEGEFFAVIGNLFSEKHHWTHFPTGSNTEAFRHKAFVVLSRAAAAVHALLRVPHQTYPIKLFLLVDTDSERAATSASQLARDPSCVQDGFSQKLLEQYA